MLRRNSLTHSQARQTRTNSYNSHKQNNVLDSSNGTRNVVEQPFISRQASLTDSRIIKKLNISETMQLTRLDLSHNQIKGQTAFWSAIKQLTNLKSLDLQHNSLTHAHLGYLPEQLTELHLNHNYIHELSLNRYLPHLKILECRYNKLLKISFPIANPALESVSVSYNKLSILNTVELTNLEKLEADHNQLVVINLNPTIKRVQLRECSLKSLMFMSKLKVVKELDLSGNKLSDVRLNTYLQKDDMELLNLSNNAIKYVQGLDVACPKLRYLYLNNNQIYSLKSIYTELVKLTKLEILDLSINEFEKIEDNSYTHHIMMKLQGQLIHLNTLNGIQVRSPIETRIYIQGTTTEMIRTLQRVPKSHKQPETHNKQNKYPPRNPSCYEQIRSNKPTKQTGIAIYTPSKSEVDTPGNTQRAYSNSNCSQFKESPYRLCADLLTSTRSNSGYKKASQPIINITANDNINFTLGERESRCFRQVLESKEDNQNLFPSSILAEKNLNTSQNYGTKHQNISFGCNKTNHSLSQVMEELRDGLIDLEEFSVIPARPIFKSERGKDITVKVEDGPQLEIFVRLFTHYNKRPDLLKKNTNLNRQAEILSDRVAIYQRSSVGFLRVPQLDGKLFRQVVNGKVPFTNFLCDARNASVSHVPNRVSSWHIVVLMGSQPSLQMDSEEGIPIEQIDKLTPVYYIETNDK